MAANHKRLIVEGNEDLFAVVSLMRAHVNWPKSKDPKDWPVQIEIGWSVDEILAPGRLTTMLKGSEAQALGVMIDANDHFASRWAKLRGYCLSLFPSIPSSLPSDGLVVTNSSNNRLGIWIMPDNGSPGMLESFLRHLVKDDGRPLLARAKRAVSAARKAGAPYRKCHTHKADIHTWLAWQDPPGLSFGRAIVKEILDPTCPNAAKFANWFRSLYQL